MNKPIIFTVCIAIAACVGLIGGMQFGGFYHRDIVQETIYEYDKTSYLFACLAMLVSDEQIVKDLESIKEIADLELIKKKYRGSGLLHVRQLQKQVSSMKKEVPNPSALKDYEKISEEYKAFFKKNAP